ncbi:MAG: helix-turn-helix transcriptional regulator [Lachnospiraceae bacterium]|nr:helix-turn-helix transcriptional regulator [Lachnospiraceae bacterium]
MSFSEKIYALRTQAGMSQASFAEKLQVSRQTVSKWELGTSYPEIEKLLAISNLFHVTTDYLLKDQSDSQEDVKMDRLVLQFLGYAQDMDGISKELVNIMRDGIIDDEEKVRMNDIVKTLNEVARMIEEIKLALRDSGIF